MGLPDTAENLTYKAFAVTSKSYAGRGCEVYELDFEDVEQKKAVSAFLANGKVARFTFNYRSDYEGADAILIANMNGVFALTGRIIDFPFLKNELTPISETLVEQPIEEEGMDFGML